MSAGAATVPSAQRTDLRHTVRIFAAVILPIGPACVAVLRYVLPYSMEGSAASTIDAIEAHADRQNLVVWLGTIAVLTLIPSVIWAGRLTRRAAPRLSAVAVSLLVVGYIGLGSIVSVDAMAWYGVTHDLDHSTLAALFANGHATVAIDQGLFVLGHVLGTILLGIALWRTRVVPRWAAVATILAQPLHFTAAVIVGSPSLDLFAWGLNTVGFAAVSVAILRLPDDEWDLAPA
jgi:hypothetical protein